MLEVFFRFTLFGHEIKLYSYGFMFGLGCALATLLFCRLAERERIERPRALPFAIGVIVCGLIGGHLHSLLTDDTVEGTLDLVAGSGFTFYGAALSGTFASWPIGRLLGIPFWTGTDLAAPPLALAHALGRVGCFFSGCCFGSVVSEGAGSVVGVRFPRGSQAWNHHFELGLVGPDAPWSLPVVPTQLIETIWELGVLGFLLRCSRNGSRRPGTVMLAYFLCYGLLRAVVERVRDDPGRGTLLGVSTPTAIGVATALFAGLALGFAGLLARRASVRAQPSGNG